MPEYLSPGVYVEEIDTGNKSIEGVSTSTAGMVGVTERGPLNVPILITSYGEYRRWFGERLAFEDFNNNGDGHCYLPHAIEGFFQNNGKRVYVTRVLNDQAAASAEFILHDRGANTSEATMLLRPAAETTGLAASPLYVLNTNNAFPNSGALTAGDEVRVGDGSESEYRIVGVIGAPAPTIHVPVNMPLTFAHATGAPVAGEIVRTPIALGPGGGLTVNLAANSGAGALTLLGATAGSITALATGQILEIGPQFSAEFRFITAITPIDGTHCRVTLDAPIALAADLGLAVTPLDETVAPINPALALDMAAQSGDAVVYVAGRGANYTDNTHLVVLGTVGQPGCEVRRIGILRLVTTTTGAYVAYPEGTAVVGVNMADDGATAVKNTTAAALVGAAAIALDNRTNLVVGDVLRITDGVNQEFAAVVGIPNPSPGNAPPNAGTVLLSQPLINGYANGSTVHRETPPTVNANRVGSTLVAPTAAGNTFLAVSDSGEPPAPAPHPLVAADVIRVTTPLGGVYYHSLASATTALNASPVTITQPVEHTHATGSPLVGRDPLILVEAIDLGGWGNRLRISVEDETPGLVADATIAAWVTQARIRFSSTVGMEPGTILEVVNPASNAGFPDLIKVDTVNRTTSEVTLNPALSVPLWNLITAAPAGTFHARSREFRMTVRLLHQVDPANPSRNELVIDSEVFPHLSMDMRHSRYFQTILGDRNGPPRLSDRRPDGESWYVRVEDQAANDAERQSLRLGPEALVDRLPNRRTSPARHPLEGGLDAINMMIDDIYVGQDNVNPEARTGLYSLLNIDEISIVAVPGRTGPIIQGELIIHCENQRYRFAVLDGPHPPHDSLADVQQQRQQFDTKYAALYHPWLLIEDPYPTNASNVGTFTIPPSGHVVGIYARTDVDRGVHKAPANEVVSGILGLQRILNKSEQDILNPYPVNINVIRDFRPDNRSIRVWGGRVITSDTDWKYVNVRRLLIFIEKSIDIGLQWVVFEPNADPLWARVRRTISNFLTTVWRNGALEGLKPEEAYFVKCDRTTMTQTDIDNGRLIVVIGVAPVKPAEFVIIRIGLWTAHADS